MSLQLETAVGESGENGDSTFIALDQLLHQKNKGSFHVFKSICSTCCPLRQNVTREHKTYITCEFFM